MKLLVVGLFGTLLVNSLGIDIYSRIDSKNIEDIEKDLFAFGWFVASIVLSVILAIVGILLLLFLPIVKHYLWIWNIVLTGMAVISSALAWDLTTRVKSTAETYYLDRKVFMFFTALYIVLWFLSLRGIPSIGNHSQLVKQNPFMQNV